MKKKLFSVFAAVLVLVICIAALVACNPYKADSIEAEILPQRLSQTAATS